MGSFSWRLIERRRRRVRFKSRAKFSRIHAAEKQRPIPDDVTNRSMTVVWYQARIVSAVFDRDILALDEAGLLQPLTKSTEALCVPVRRLTVEKPNHRHPRLLRPHGQRLRRCCAAEQRDELAALHSITSSAVASSVGGTVRPSIRAVWWLMTSSNFDACTTGRSAGFAPLRMRPV